MTFYNIIESSVAQCNMCFVYMCVFVFVSVFVFVRLCIHIWMLRWMRVYVCNWSVFITL